MSENQKKELKKIQSDADLRSAVKKLQESGTNLQGINDDIKEALNLDGGNGRGILAKALAKVTPKSWMPALPARVSRYIMEETDVMNMMESQMEGNLNNTQEALRTIAQVTIKKKEELQQLEEDIKRAEKENWSAQELQNYMAEKAGIEIFDEVVQLLDEEFEALTEEEREEQKQDILNNLKGNIVIGNALLETLRRSAIAGLTVFRQGMKQYHDFTQAQREMSALRDTARELTKTSQAMFAARGVLSEVFIASLEAINHSVKAAQLVDKYSITSGAMLQLLDQGRKTLDKELLEFKQKRKDNMKQLTGPNKDKGGADQDGDGDREEGEVIVEEVKPKNEKVDKTNVVDAEVVDGGQDS